VGAGGRAALPQRGAQGGGGDLKGGKKRAAERKAARAAWDGTIGAAPPASAKDPLKEVTAAGGFAKAPRKGQDEELTEMEVGHGVPSW
jgi:hypothetical protein